MAEKIFEIKINCLASQFTDKSFSDALIVTSTNPQYYKRLFIESSVQYMKIPSSEHAAYMICSEYQNKYKKQFLYTSCSQHVLSMF